VKVQNIKSHYQDFISRLTQKIKIAKILQYLRFENKLNHNYNLSFQIKNTHNKNKTKIKQEYIIY
jgi:hypothetical protein